MIFKATDKCFICGHEISWMAHVKEGPSGAYGFGSEAQAEIIATGKAMSNENNVEYEVIVCCPRCRNKNKYKHSFKGLR